ncbi:MAG: glycosyltransferase [bacterium]|nr:glycosyltransferase [bacterium]
MPAVSVVIPLKNKGPHIACALNSVLAQTFQDFEIIVVDGSTDGGTEIVREFADPRIRLIKEEKQGVSAARNQGIAAARGELIAFLDADDEWTPRHLETLLRLRENYPEAGAYGTARLTIMEDSTVLVSSYSDDIPPAPWEGLLPNYFRAAVRGTSPLLTSIVAVPKCILNEMGGFNTNAWFGEDADLWGRIALKYPVAFSWDGMGIYHEDTSNRATNKKKPIREHVFVISARTALQAGEVPPELKEDFLEYVASRQIQIAYRNLEAGRPDLARDNLKGCKTRYLWKKYWALLWAYIPSRIYLTLKPHRIIKMLYNWNETIRCILAGKLRF